MKLPLVHFDCTQFHGDKPCQPNKLYGVFCGECSLYEKEESLPENFPIIKEPEFYPQQDKCLKIIIVKLDAVGDVLRTTSLLPALKKKYANSEIYWITKEQSFPVLQDNFLIDEIYFDCDELNPLYNESFDIAINLDSGKNACAIMNNLIASERFGFELVNGRSYPVNEFANRWYLMGINDSFKKQNSKTYHEIIHEICGLNYEGAKPFLGLNGEIAKSAEKFKSDFRLKKFSRFYLINLGGGSRWQYKKWTAEGYAEIANRLTENPDIAAGIIAGEEDMDFYFSVEKLILNRPNVLHLGFSNSMENFIAILSVADRILTSDSLAFHIATALEKFVVVLVGPTSHTELDIFNKGKVIYSSSVDCLCCYLNSCGKTVTCMNTLISEHVYMELTSGR